MGWSIPVINDDEFPDARMPAISRKTEKDFFGSPVKHMEKAGSVNEMLIHMKNVCEHNRLKSLVAKMRKSLEILGQIQPIVECGKCTSNFC